VRIRPGVDVEMGEEAALLDVLSRS
jgi:hypothetical protein